VLSQTSTMRDGNYDTQAIRNIPAANRDNGCAEEIMFEPGNIADYFLIASRERGEILTNLKLQKLLYYAQAWFLVKRDKPLFQEDFEAWIHGPILTSQYSRFSPNSWRSIEDEIAAPQLPGHVTTHLDEVLDVFGVESAIALEAMTHAEEPWREARGKAGPDEPSTAIINKETMKQFYRAL
jgi:uncharacterized phage-associated protein